MSSSDTAVFALAEESLRQRWLTRERLRQVTVEVIDGAGLDILIFGDTANGGQPHSFPNVRAPFAHRFEPGAIFAGLSYTLVRRPGSDGPLFVRISGARMG